MLFHKCDIGGLRYPPNSAMGPMGPGGPMGPRGGPHRSPVAFSGDFLSATMIFVCCKGTFLQRCGIPVHKKGSLKDTKFD